MCSWNGHIDDRNLPPSPCFGWLLSLEWLSHFEHIIHSPMSFWRCVFLMYVLGATPNYIPLKCRCVVKTSNWNHAHLPCVVRMLRNTELFNFRRGPWWAYESLFQASSSKRKVLGMSWLVSWCSSWDFLANYGDYPIQIGKNGCSQDAFEVKILCRSITVYSNFL